MKVARVLELNSGVPLRIEPRAQDSSVRASIVRSSAAGWLGEAPSVDSTEPFTGTGESTRGRLGLDSAVHLLRDRDTAQAIVGHLAQQGAKAVLSLGGHSLDARAVSFGEDGLTLQTRQRASHSTGTLALARLELHGVIFLVRGAVRPVDLGYCLEPPLQVGTWNRRSTRRVSLPAGSAKLLWMPVSSRSASFRRAPVSDLGVDGVGLDDSPDSDVPPPPSKFPALLEVGGEQIPCLAEACSTDVASARRGIRLHSGAARSVIAGAYLRQRFPQLVTRREVEPMAVVELFRKSGYLDLRTGTLPPDTWFQLPGTDGLSRDVCYRALDGRLIGHTSATRAYSRAWLGHQIATLREHPETVACRRDIYLHIASYATLIDGEDTVMYGYFDRSKKWHQLFFHDFVRWVGNPAEAVIAELDRFERRDPSAPLAPPAALPAGVEISSARGNESVVATALVRAQLPELVAETLDIHPQRLQSDALHQRYDGSPYTRAREVLVLRVAGRVAGVALCEIGSRELSLFNLFNMAFFFFAGGADAVPRALQLALLARVRAFYAGRGEYNPLVVAPPGTFDATAEQGTELVETMGLIAKSGRALRQYESFLDYHFGKHISASS